MNPENTDPAVDEALASSSSSSSENSASSYSSKANENDPNMVVGGPKKEAEQVSEEEQAEESVQPVESPGVEAWDVSSQRETEIFEPEDVVFVREGSANHLTAYPRHEAETRFVEITDKKSKFKDSKTVTNYELADGTKVTRDGVTVIVTLKDGEAEIEGPSLNAHAPSESH